MGSWVFGITSVGMVVGMAREEQPIYKGIKQSNKHILRMHKHDFCGGTKYIYPREILANENISIKYS